MQNCVLSARIGTNNYAYGFGKIIFDRRSHRDIFTCPIEDRAYPVMQMHRLGKIFRHVQRQHPPLVEREFIGQAQLAFLRRACPVDRVQRPTRLWAITAGDGARREPVQP